MTPPVYSNGFGKFLAGLLIPNSEIEDYLELVPFPDFFTGEERAIENTGVALRPNRFRHRTS